MLHLHAVFISSPLLPLLIAAFPTERVVSQSPLLLVPILSGDTTDGPRWRTSESLPCGFATRLFAAAAASPAGPPALTLEDVTCSHNGGETFQLRHVNYVLPRGRRVALVGRNGTGKSTLLKILASEAAGYDVTSGMQYSGEIVTPRDVRIAYVEQEPLLSPDVTVLDAVLGMTDHVNGESSPNNNVFATARAYRRALQNVAELPAAFAAAAAVMDAQDGWSVLTRADEVATRLRIQHLFSSRLDQISGGERKRVALAAALVQEPDVLLLDEPTNFLSLAGVKWLTDLLLLTKSVKTVLFVTHDRAFLDEVSDSILELDRGQLYEYQDCTYADYLERKQERLALEDTAQQARQAKYKMELDWMRRQPQARESKSKARIDAFYKLEKATRPRSCEANLQLLDGGDRKRLGGKIMSVRGLNLKFGDKVLLNEFSYDFLKGDRICLSGANGVGKTTFVRILTGQQAPDSGTIEVGDTVVTGVYDQLGLEMDDPNQTVLDYVLQKVLASGGGATTMTDAPAQARKLLKQFEFPSKRWSERISFLSGGEKRRLQMLGVLSMKPNFLIMDEPSVDCDLDTLAALEEYLLAFDGVLLIVSHDRYFSDKVADHLFIFEGNGEIKDFYGSLSEYGDTLVETENDKVRASSTANVGSATAKAQRQDKMARNHERNELRQAKKDLGKVEEQLDKLKQLAAAAKKELDETSPDQGWSVLAEVTDKLNAIQQQIEDKEMEWMEPAELLEQCGEIQV